MAVTLDATLGGSTSNSYVEMTTAVAIAENIPGGGDWIALDEEIRNLSLIQATRWMETLDYRGDRCAADQRLKWPRSGAECDGVTSVCTAIPYAIQEAEVALAIKYNGSPAPSLERAAAALHRLERTLSAKKSMYLKLNTTNSPTPNPAAATAVATQPSSKPSPGSATSSAVGSPASPPATTK